MKRNLLCPLIAMSMLMFSGCDDGGNSSASRIQETTVTTTEPVVTDGDVNVDFKTGVVYTMNTGEENYNFLLENFKDYDFINEVILVENQSQLEELNLNYTYENGYIVDGVQYTWNSPDTAEEIKKKYDGVKEKIFSSYNDDFFKENSVVFFMKSLGAIPNKDIHIKEVYKEKGVLTLFVVNYLKEGTMQNGAMESYCGFIELKKDDIKDIIDVKMEYELEIYSDGE
ncbi:MAG: hypothetical protein LBL93_05010 [Ruminococcus sp.]|jgi:hypothetical protein|nr:hypothetical protein [Ruminococcus sp.]